MEVEESFDLLFKELNFEDTDTILPLVRKCISMSPGEKEILRALEIALCFCLKNFSVDELEEVLFKTACPAAMNVLIGKLTYLESNPSSCVESLGVSLKIIGYFVEVFDYLNEVHQIAIIEVKSFLIATCEILLKCFSHCKIIEKVYGALFDSLTEHLSNFFKKCCELLDHLLKFLTEKIKCDIADDIEVLLLSDIMSFLSKSGFVLINLEVKTMAKLWKAFAFLIEKYLCCLKNNYNIGETIRELCCNIISNVEGVLYKNDQDFNKVIKLNCFLLKLVIKFSEAFVGCLKNCQNFLLNLLLILCKWEASLEAEVKSKTYINLDLMTQLTVGTDPLLSQLMTDEKFIQECQAVSKDLEKSVEFSILCCLILKKLLVVNLTTRSLWFNENENILEWIFLSSSSSRFITCSNIRLPTILIDGTSRKFTDLYEYVFVNTSAFLMTATADEYRLVEKTLIENVLQTNPVRSLLAIDIWCILARFAGSDLLFNQVLTLSKVFNEFHPETLRVEKWYLASLIGRLHPLLTEKHKALFLKSLPPSFSSGIRECCFDGVPPDRPSDVIQSLVDQVERSPDEAEPFNVGLESPTIRQNVYSVGKSEPKIIKLWKFDCEVLSSCPEYSKFLKSVCIVTGQVVSQVSSETLLTVLLQMKRLLKIGQPTHVKLYLIYILNSLSGVKIPSNELQKKLLTIIAELFRDLLLSKNVFVKQKAFETFYTFSHITSHGEVISLTVQNNPQLQTEVINFFKKEFPNRTDVSLDDFIHELYQLKFEHVCRVIEPAEGVMAKRFKPDCTDMEEITVRWKEDAKKIVERFNLLSESQKRELKNVCGSLLTLLR